MPKATHKTHASALYRRDGGKLRPVKMIRPTLRQIEVVLRKIRRGVKAAKAGLRSDDAGVLLASREALAKLYTQRGNIETYFKGIAKA